MRLKLTGFGAGISGKFLEDKAALETVVGPQRPCKHKDPSFGSFVAHGLSGMVCRILMSM